MATRDEMENRKNPLVPTWWEQIREHQNRIRWNVRPVLPALAVVAIISVVSGLLSIPREMEIEQTRKIILPAVHQMTRLTVTETVANINPNFFLRLVDTDAAQQRLLRAIQSSSEVPLNHPFPLSGGTISFQTPSDQKIEVNFEIAQMNNELVVLATIYGESSKHEMQDLGIFGGADLNALLGQDHDGLEAVYAKYRQAR